MGHGNWHHTLVGLGFALLGTFLFSCGNMFSRRMGRYTLSLTNTVFWGMLSGAAIMALFIPVTGHGYGFPLTWRWMTGLVYLILFGSIVGFLFYLELVRRIGADRAAYATILSPVIALGMSAFLSRYTGHYPCWRVSCLSCSAMFWRFCVASPCLSRSKSNRAETDLTAGRASFLMGADTPHQEKDR